MTALESGVKCYLEGKMCHVLLFVLNFPSVHLQNELLPVLDHQEVKEVGRGLQCVIP